MKMSWKPLNTHNPQRHSSDVPVSLNTTSGTWHTPVPCHSWESTAFITGSSYETRLGGQGWCGHHDTFIHPSIRYWLFHACDLAAGAQPIKWVFLWGRGQRDPVRSERVYSRPGLGPGSEARLSWVTKMAAFYHHGNLCSLLCHYLTTAAHLLSRGY